MGIHTKRAFYSKAIAFVGVSLNFGFAINGTAASDLELDFLATENIPFEFSPGLGLVLAGGLFALLKKNQRR